MKTPSKAQPLANDHMDTRMHHAGNESSIIPCVLDSILYCVITMRNNNNSNCKSKSAVASSAGLVYAVANGPRPGIYFDWTPSAIQGISNAQWKSFPSIAQAQRYLESKGLLPPPAIADGWISTKTKSPILYMHRDDDDDDDDGQTTIPPTVSTDSTTGSTLPQHPQSPATSSSNDGITETTRLDAMQQRAVDAALAGQNVFLTGVAGTGKSLVTKLIYQQALQRHGGATAIHTGNSSNKRRRGVQQHVKVALTAPTGMAAVGLGPTGQTIHSLARVKIPLLRACDFASMHHPANAPMWQRLCVLIMDEVGMLSADFLDWLDVNVRKIRRRPLEVFGGIQLILVGDFAQLGPIPGTLSMRGSSQGDHHHLPPFEPTHKAADCFLGVQETTAFAFQSAVWRQAYFCNVNLTNVYRQSDRDFCLALQDLRQQHMSELVQRLVQKCSVPLEDLAERQKVFGAEAIQIPKGLLPTLLYTNNRNADRENADRLASLTTEHKRFEAMDSVHVDETVPPHALGQVKAFLKTNKFFEQCQAPQQLDLKIGAQVMLVQNCSLTKLVNGSRGVVERFVLVPLLSDLKGQEQRLLGPQDSEWYPGFCFEQLKFGMTFEIHGKTFKIIKFVKYPLVRFLNNEARIILPTTFERTLYHQGTCVRVQLPLRLSWALTIHKSQGCTLDWVICDLAGCFTAGQAYVALSRAKNMAGLQIRNFTPEAVKTNPLVDRFYQALASSDNAMEEFLEKEAGLWWYPIYYAPDWLRMFREACGTRKARENSQQFSMWVANYAPPSNYQGWKGYSDERGRSAVSTTRTPPQPITPKDAVAVAAFHPHNNNSSSSSQRHMVTPSLTQSAAPVLPNAK